MKHFRVNVSLVSDTAGIPGVVWALVYVPSGASIGSLSTSDASSLYEPS